MIDYVFGNLLYHDVVKNDFKFMQRALELARHGGRGTSVHAQLCRAVAPNPMVGAVIISAAGRVIGEGWHKKFGGPHAEVNAIRSVKRPGDLRGATLYVTLEPCRHWGKTPPCIDLIRKVGIARVIAGSRDPFQKTENRIQFLKGSTAEECVVLNKFFFTWVTKKRPYITVKIAMSPDGFVAGKNGQTVHITNRAQDRVVHRLRAQHQAIMVGVNTVIADNPHLGVRLVKGQDPLRIILDFHGRTPRGAKVRRNKNYRIIHSKKGYVNLKKLMKNLAKEGISSVFVEPGPTLYRSLKKAGLIDELVVFRGKKIIGQGLPLVL